MTRIRRPMSSLVWLSILMHAGTDIMMPWWSKSADPEHLPCLPYPRFLVRSTSGHKEWKTETKRQQRQDLSEAFRTCSRSGRIGCWWCWCLSPFELGYIHGGILTKGYNWLVKHCHKPRWMPLHGTNFKRPCLLAQELLEIRYRHVDAVPSNGRRSTQDEEGDVCPLSGRSLIFNQAIH